MENKGYQDFLAKGAKIGKKDFLAKAAKYRKDRKEDLSVSCSLRAWRYLARFARNALPPPDRAQEFPAKYRKDRKEDSLYSFFFACLAVLSALCEKRLTAA